MKIPKVFQPVLGVMAGAFFFLAGIAVTSCMFVGMFKAVQYAKPYMKEAINICYEYISQWLPL